MSGRDTSRDVAIIGIACRFAGADDQHAFWSTLLEGKDSFGPVPAERWDHEAVYSERFRENDKTYVKRGAFIDDVDSFAALHFGIAPRRLQVMDPQHRLVLETTRVALIDAGIEHSRRDLDAMGTFIGVSTSEYRNLVISRTMALMMASGELGDNAGTGEALSNSVANVAPISAFSMPGVLMNMAAANVANTWKLGGPAFTVDAACASSLVAVHDAVTHIRAGICNTALAGGVYLNLTPEALVGFSRIGAISQRGEMRPFDANADGFLQGDGCGVVVLKKFDDAIADGDRVYAVIRGTSANNDAGRSSGPMAPSLDGQRDVIRAAVRDANVDPTTIDFVSCHGTATPVGDPVEVGAIRDVLATQPPEGTRAKVKERDTPVYLGSAKGNFGHTMSAAGVAGFIHAVLCLHHEVITPQAGFATPHPQLELEDGAIVVPTAAVAWPRRGDSSPRRAGVSSFGFGGTNCHIVLEEAPFRSANGPVATAAATATQVVVLHADNVALLADYAEQLADDIDGRDDLDAIAYTLSVTRRANAPSAPRLAVVADDVPSLQQTLRGAAKTLRNNDEPPTVLSPNAFFGAGEASRVAFMFPGQGAQQLGLFEDLVRRYPQFASHLARLGAAAEPTVGAAIGDLLYPQTRDDAALERLTRTEVCQPVMVAVGLALRAFLHDLGVQPSVTFGHSLGEFAAAAAGGMMSDEAAVKFVADRGQLMAALKIDDQGAMVAAMADAATVRAQLAEGAQLANLNHPTQTVISGTTEAVDATAASLVAAGIKATKLRVSHAFHSPVVASIKPQLAKLVEALRLQAPQLPVVSAITGAPYELDGAAQTFVEHTTSTVDFMAALNAAAQHADVFLEVGAGGTLVAFANGTLEAPRALRTLGARRDDDGTEFHRALAVLCACGVDVQLQHLHDARRVTSLVPAPLERSKHWVVRDKQVALDVPAASQGGAIMSQDTSNVSADLVALFREQNEILRQHAAIIAAQAAALGGQPIPVPAASTVPVAQQVVAPTTPVAPLSVASEGAATEVPVAEVEAAPEQDFGALVRDAVASVSAFPVDALADEQQLARDLGFDSLMFVDLAADLQKRIPGLAVPQAAFNQSTTIGEVIAFLHANVGEPAAKADAATSETAAADAPLRRWHVAWADAPEYFPGTRFAPAGKVVISAPDGDAAATALAVALAQRAVDVEVADLNKVALPAGTQHVIHLADRDASDALSVVERLRTLSAALQPNNPQTIVLVASPTAAPAVRGALRGFAKALGQEWGDVRALSLETDDATAVLAELDDAARYAEVRVVGGNRQVTALTPLTAAADGKLTNKDVVLITGGARGIGRACAKAILDTTDAKLLLVGRSPARAVDLKEFGKRATYVQWDVTTPLKGKLPAAPTVVVHAAGVIRDAQVHNKSADDVRTVVGIKVAGLQNVLNAAGKAVKRVIGFGSWAGRFGNAAQTDYAAANDAMTEMLRASQVSAVNIDWPIWTDSEMGDSIPQSLQEMMRQRGVTFISTEEGVAAFLNELNGAATGEVILGREIDRGAQRFDGAWQASLATMPYVADHVVRGVPLIPFAGALDLLGTAATAVAGDAAIRLHDVKLFKGLDLSTPADLVLTATSERGRGTAELHARGELAYRSALEVAEAVDLEAFRPALEGDAVTPQLTLATFYDEVAFHGPKIQGITKIEGIAPRWIVGTVKTSTPAQLLEANNTHERWTVDPLVIDAAMQLVLFHLKSLHGFGAIPFAIDDYTQVRPFVGSWVRCSMSLDDMSDGVIVGTIAFEDERGLAAVMTRLRAKEFHDEEKPADIDPQHWDISQWVEVEELEQRLQMAELIGIRNPYFWTRDGVARNTALVEGREMLNYSSYNYCGFSGRPEVSQAAQDAIAHYGTSVSASRIASGQIPLHQELEDAIASFIGTEATLVFAAGHMTNETVIGHLFGKNDLIIHDSLAHNSILTGAELSGAKRMSFPHSDWEALDRALTRLRGGFEKVGIFIEGVYSMDGDIPDLQKFIDIKRKHRALLYVDEAHSIGVIGPRGAGISDYFGIDPMDVDIWMGTLSKAFASCGGYITGSKQLIQYLKYTTPAFVFSAGISPANAAAALASCRLLAASPEIPQLLQKRAALFVELCKERGIDTGLSKDSAVVPAIVGNSLDCLRLSANLAQRGVNVQPIVYPAVDDDASRLRFFLSATHTEENLRQTADILAEELANVRNGAAAE